LLVWQPANTANDNASSIFFMISIFDVKLVNAG